MTSKLAPKLKALRISELKVNDISIGDKKIDKTVPIKFKNGPIVFQTPFLEVIDGIRKTNFPEIFVIDTLFKGTSKHKIHQFYQFIEALETHISTLVEKNGTKWFDEKNVILKSLIRELENNNKLCFTKWPFELKNIIFIGENKEPFNHNEIKKGDAIRLIVEIPNLWVDKTQFGLAVVVKKIMVKPYCPKSEYDFNEDSDNDAGETANDDIISLLATEQKTRPKPSNQPVNMNAEVELIDASKATVKDYTSMPNMPNMPNMPFDLGPMTTSVQAHSKLPSNPSNQVGPTQNPTPNPTLNSMPNKSLNQKPTTNKIPNQISNKIPIQTPNKVVNQPPKPSLKTNTKPKVDTTAQVAPKKKNGPSSNKQKFATETLDSVSRKARSQKQPSVQVYKPQPIPNLKFSTKPKQDHVRFAISDKSVTDIEICEESQSPSQSPEYSNNLPEHEELYAGRLEQHDQHEQLESLEPFEQFDDRIDSITEDEFVVSNDNYSANKNSNFLKQLVDGYNMDDEIMLNDDDMEF